ncbi:hypothetical protein L1987_23437 [Smallanthus sonchifolius]|uniref:Uncharacterized protein n=1 Tax=Smallanthus sonchifolius TaxID=185202 RepID=A0ACB9IK96_9ASTR|nr:hypothetical protein L1987_23437 [Smallanthus sonchifolius]
MEHNRKREGALSLSLRHHRRRSLSTVEWGFYWGRRRRRFYFPVFQTQELNYDLSPEFKYPCYHLPFAEFRSQFSKSRIHNPL